ncbi:MAG: hypothetical protein ACLFVR_12530 [Thiohalospira sp.]
MKQVLLPIALGWCFITFLPASLVANTNNSNKTESENSVNDDVEASNSPEYFINQKRNFNFSSIDDDSNTFSTRDNSASELEFNEETDTDSAIFYIQKANELLTLVEDENRLIDKLDSAALITLPVGIKKTIGGLDYTILIDEVNFRPEGAFFNALMSFKPPQGEALIFKGRDIPFSFSGGLQGDAFLELVSDISLNYGDGIDLKIKGKGKTFAVWDCHGFKKMKVSADISFSEDLIVPENENGEVIEGQRVYTSFTAEMSDWNDLIVSIDLPAFQVKGVDGVGFSIENAVFDFSDRNNFSSMKFPSGYTSTYFVEGNRNLWRGIYIGSAKVRLPKEINSSDGKRTSFLAYELLIDDQGFSGKIIAEHILSLEKGRMGKWAFSLDKIGVELSANQLTKAGFEGLVQVPVLDEENPLQYTALIDVGGEYSFTISTTEKVKLSAWSADVNLAPTSYIEVDVVDSEFQPRAVLNGNANIKIADDDVELADLAFETLEIKSTKPYISVGNFSFGSEAVQQTTAGFPVSIENIAFKEVSDTKAGLNFDIILNLVGEGDGGFGAECGLMIVGEMGNDSGIQSWKYSYLELTKIAVDIDGGAYKVSGSLTFFKNDQYYGNGFNGQASIEIIDLVKIEGTAIFGKVDGFRYWYADAMATFKKGIPLGAVALNKFGGGVFHHMRQLDIGEEFGSTLGTSVSGVVYRPDREVLIGIKASVGLILNSAETVFNGDATLEVTFNHGGGLRTIDFQGNANFITSSLPGPAAQLSALRDQIDGMTKGENPKRSSSSALSAQISINMNFPEKTLHANMKVYVNVADVIRGVGPGDLAGESVMHFSPGEWYIHVGSPDNPVGLEVIGILQLQSYFMVGDYIPGSPPPPDEVSRILGDIDLDYMEEENQLSSGRGIAFGARITMDTGDLEFLIFYARFAAGIGFDLMMKDYGDIRCAGRSGEIGVNGWYANGQSFAYFSGKIGINVKIFGKSKKYEIIDLGMAAVLQAKLPNPLWMRGIVGGYYSILGGLIKGDCKFEVIIGEECDFVGEGSVLEGIEVIADIAPADGKDEVDVFNSPQAVFNMEINKIFEMVDLDGKRKAFRIKLDHFDIYNGNQKLETNYKWNADHTVVALKPDDILPGNSNIKVVAQISFEERDRSIWKPVKVDGVVITESREINFTTGEAPDYIPVSNVDYCYPILNHYNFYYDEYSKGYIQLIQGQDYLFENNPGFITKGRYTSHNGNEYLFDIHYNSTANEIEYNIPDGLVGETIYSLDLITIPESEDEVDKNITTSRKIVALGEENKEQDISVTTRAAEGEIKSSNEKVIFTSHFRTSKYATLGKKLDDMFISTGFRRNLHSDIHELGVTISGPELFEKYETYWTTEITPLIQFEAVLTDNYYQNKIRNLIYNPYNSQSTLQVEWRDPNFDIGFPPVKALYIRQMPFNKTLTQNEINGGYFLGTATEGAFVYNLIWFYANDFIELQQQASYQLNQGNNNNWYQTLMETSFPIVYSGNYPFKVKYVLPGKNIVTSEHQITISNNL